MQSAVVLLSSKQQQQQQKGYQQQHWYTPSFLLQKIETQRNLQAPRRPKLQQHTEQQQDETALLQQHAETELQQQ